MRTTIRKLLSHNGRMYELFYWLSVFSDWMKEDNEIKKWIDGKESYYWAEWVTK